MNTSQRIIKNTLSLLLSGLVAQLFIFFAMIYLARVLGPGDFGKISFATALIAYFTLATHLGLPLLGAREIAKSNNDISCYFSNIIFLRFSLAVLSFTLLCMLIFFLPKSLELKRLVLLYGLGLFFSALRVDWVFQGIEKMEFIGLSRILSASVFLGFALLFVKNNSHLLLVPCFHVFGVLVAALALLTIFFKTHNKFQFKLDFKFCKKIFRQALPLGISIILIEVIYSIDTIMLGFMRTNVEVGYYNAAYKLILPLIMVGSIYFDAVFPVISKYYESSLDSLRRLQSYNAKLMAIAALPLGIMGTVLASPIMNVLYDSKYNNSVIAFQILIWAAAMIYLNMIYARGMWACNLQNQYVKIVIGQAVTNITLNFLLIPFWGIVGASISTVFAELVGFFFYYHAFNKIVHVPIHKFIFKPLVSSVLMLLVLGFTHQLHLIFSILSALVVYFSSLYFIKGISRDDIKSIVGVFAFDRAR